MNHEESMRRAQEMQLQLQLEVRRIAPNRFGPAVDGVLWSRIDPDGEANESPQTPLLSILEFTLRPGIDLRDDTKQPRKLWDAALQYIRSIPGCCTVEWGPRLEDPPAAILCMIHWDSTAAWRKFQHSLGSIMRLLCTNASNRCAKLSATVAPILCSTRDGATIVDVVSVTFVADDVSSPERRSAFEESWNVLASSVTNGNNGLRHSHTVWLENNATIFLNPTPAEAAAATKLATFTAFLAWDAAEYDGRHVEYICDTLRASPSSLHGNMPTISQKAVQLINQDPQEDHAPPRQPAAPPASLDSILKIGISRQCSADLDNLKAHASQALDRSIGDARARLRLFPAPMGSFISQGELYDDNMPVIPEWRITWRSVPGYHHVDVVWMQLKRSASRAQCLCIFNQLNNESIALPGFVKAFWARDVEHKAKIAVLTVWEEQNATAASLDEYRRILDDFAGSSAHLAAPLTRQAFLITSGSADLWLFRVEYLELTSFYIPSGALESQLFEQAYGAFIRFVFSYFSSIVHLTNHHTTVQLMSSCMTEPSVVAGIPKACTTMEAGGWQPAKATGHSGSQLFTGVLTWASPAARQEWYGELFRLSCWSYELFGHTLDAMKILAAGGVETRFLALQKQ
ncbi:hypothetical protein BX600DRAFT_385995 [Xylariales sp. PMI_506]|nr:hypothetical protein BX600DRAFT_385995 [Xylariales sp. PMI_506]